MPERVSPGDLVQIATDVGPVPMNVGALLALGPGADPVATAAPVSRRLHGVRRLRQRLVHPPPGLGRPYWADADRVPAVPVVELGGRRLLDVATDAVVRPLDLRRPPWRAVVVADGGRAVGVVVVVHHVLADGMSGLTLLRGLVDEGAGGGSHDRLGTGPEPPSARRPTTLDLLLDVWDERRRALRALPATARRWRDARGELGRRTGLAPRCSLCLPTGPRRRVGAVDVDLAALRSACRRHGASVNDALVVAATGAMRAVLVGRGEDVERLVVSVPVSGRGADDDALGNRVGVIPVPAPTHGPTADRLAAVAGATRAGRAAGRAAGRGASAGVVGPAFRALAAVGAFRALVDRQRLVNTFLTNLVGPTATLHLAGARVEGLLPVTVTAGNVGVAFAALSYAGRLGVVAITDPDVVPELDALLAALDRELAAVAALS